MLQRGDHGDAVRRVQQRLSRLGVKLTDPPGYFGVSTEAAIYLFQRAHDLTPDGVIGPQTEARLFSSAPASLASSPIAALLDVPYLSQRDNAHRPLATCNVTSLAMALSYHGVSPRQASKQLEDELFELIHSDAGLTYYRTSSPELYARHIPPEEVLDNLVWLAQQHRVPATFAEDRSIEAIEEEVASGRTPMLSGRFTGSGHIVLLIGLCQSGDFIVHDPYGDWNHGYSSKEGAARVYAREKFVQTLKPVDRDEKWGLFIERP